VKPGFFKVF